MGQEAINTQQYYNGEGQNNSIVQLRLNSEPLLERIEFFLRGTVQQYVQTEKESGFITVASGKPKANEEGVQTILSHITGVINSQTVQGNFSLENLDRYVYDVNISLVRMIVINMHDWSIKDQDIEGICDFIMQTIEPFMSRTVNNLERQSYQTSMTTIERSSQQGGNGFLSFLRGGNK